MSRFYDPDDLKGRMKPTPSDEQSDGESDRESYGESDGESVKQHSLNDSHAFQEDWGEFPEDLAVLPSDDSEDDSQKTVDLTEEDYSNEGSQGTFHSLGESPVKPVCEFIKLYDEASTEERNAYDRAINTTLFLIKEREKDLESIENILSKADEPDDAGKMSQIPEILKVPEIPEPIMLPSKEIITHQILGDIEFRLSHSSTESLPEISTQTALELFPDTDPKSETQLKMVTDDGDIQSSPQYSQTESLNRGTSSPEWPPKTKSVYEVDSNSFEHKSVSLADSNSPEHKSSDIDDSIIDDKIDRLTQILQGTQSMPQSQTRETRKQKLQKLQELKNQFKTYMNMSPGNDSYTPQCISDQGQVPSCYAHSVAFTLTKYFLLTFKGKRPPLIETDGFLELFQHVEYWHADHGREIIGTNGFYGEGGANNDNGNLFIDLLQDECGNNMYDYLTLSSFMFFYCLLRRGLSSNQFISSKGGYYSSSITYIIHTLEIYRKIYSTPNQYIEHNKELVVREMIENSGVAKKECTALFNYLFEPYFNSGKIIVLVGDDVTAVINSRNNADNSVKKIEDFIYNILKKGLYVGVSINSNVIIPYKDFLSPDQHKSSNQTMDTQNLIHYDPHAHDDPHAVTIVKFIRDAPGEEMVVIAKNSWGAESPEKFIFFTHDVINEHISNGARYFCACGIIDVPTYYYPLYFNSLLEESPSKYDSLEEAAKAIKQSSSKYDSLEAVALAAALAPIKDIQYAIKYAINSGKDGLFRELLTTYGEIDVLNNLGDQYDLNGTIEPGTSVYEYICCGYHTMINPEYMHTLLTILFEYCESKNYKINSNTKKTYKAHRIKLILNKGSLGNFKQVMENSENLAVELMTLYNYYELRGLFVKMTTGLVIGFDTPSHQKSPDTFFDIKRIVKWFRKDKNFKKKFLKGGSNDMINREIILFIEFLKSRNVPSANSIQKSNGAFELNRNDLINFMNWLIVKHEGEELRAARGIKDFKSDSDSDTATLASVGGRTTRRKKPVAKKRFTRRKKTFTQTAKKRTHRRKKTVSKKKHSRKSHR